MVVKTDILKGVAAPPLESESRCLYTVSVDPCGLRKGKILAGYRWVRQNFAEVLPLVGDGPLIDRTAAITGVSPEEVERRSQDLAAALPGALLMSKLSRTYEFAEAMRDVEHALAASDPFSGALVADAEAYVRRVEQRGDLAMSREAAMALSREYLTHEVAMYLCQARLHYFVDTYVGRELPVLRKFLAGELDGLLPPLESRIFIGLSPGDI
jgi:hypothetical protein